MTGKCRSSHRRRDRRRRRWLKHPCFFFLAALMIFASAIVFTFDVIYLQARRSIAATYSSFLSHMWPVGMPNRTDSWENENSKTMQELLSCMGANNCKQNQTSIVLLSIYHFARSISGATSGEDIWCVLSRFGI